MKKKKSEKNKFDKRIFEDARNTLTRMFPQVSKRAFYISELNDAHVLPEGMTKIVDGAVCEIGGEFLKLRTYRRPKEKSSTLYKVDEFEGLGTKSTRRVPHNQIKDHYIKHDIPEDMMRRNQMTIEFVSDGKGGLKSNTQPNGMVKAYINFPDPMEEIIKKALKKKS